MAEVPVRSTLDAGQRHVLRLAIRDADSEGWASVSKTVWPYVTEIPSDLVELRATEDGGGLVRVTKAGVAVLTYG